MVNHNAVGATIQKMLDQAEPAVTDECCIYRVPIDIRLHNNNAYAPRFVSIGPFHRNSHSHLQNMEKDKLTYCKEFLQRTQTSSDKWITYIEEMVPQFRLCYSDTLAYSNDQLVMIIFVDCGFIFEYFLKFYYHLSPGFEPRNDIFLLTPKLTYSIRLDLAMLENQLPFFVLQGLFDLSLACASVCGNQYIPSLLKLTLNFFKFYKKSEFPLNHDDNISIRHFTDLVRIFHLQHPRVRQPTSDDIVTYVPSVSELSEAGVKFKVNTESDSLLDLKFSGRVLEIPHLEIDETATEVLFRNMIALEQFLYPFESYITYYAQVLDLLINTSRDVDILVRKRILTNWLGDTDSVAKLFNGLVQNITICNSSSHYFDICKNLNVFYEDPWNKLKSTLRRDYCSSPWQTAATIAAIVLLFLSLLQSICSVLQVIQQG